MDRKNYGLIKLSKVKKPLNPTVKPSIFGTDSDSDQGESKKKSSTSVSSSGVKRQTKIDISRALTDDPNVFEYDSIYDEMKSQKESIDDNKEHKEKKPKYINSLLKFSENRKKEQERRVERKIQKEREAEGDEFADKEAFVTNAYKQKLEELRLLEENEIREQAIDELMDVTKQNDLSGFYRNLFKNQNNNDSNQTVQIQTNESSQAQNQDSKPVSKQKPNRHIRQRRSSSEDSPEESVDNKKDSQIKSKHISKKAFVERKNNRSDKHRNDSSDEEIVAEKQESTKVLVESNALNSIEGESIENIVTNDKPIIRRDKREILLEKFVKRTVGVEYDAAKLRYLERKDNYII